MVRRARAQLLEETALELPSGGQRRIPWSWRCDMNNPIGLHSVGLHEYPIETVIQRVATAGYDAVELKAETLL